MKIANRKCIRQLSVKNMKGSRYRNGIAALAIMLTTMLFTSLFTIVMSAVYGYENSNFRMVGGYAHGGLKRLTEEQFEEFKTDSHISSYGKRRLIGFTSEEPFHKAHVEISSIDENYAAFSFVEFRQGGLPAEHTREAAADTKVLSLLGVAQEIGTEFTMSFDVGGVKTTETFVLSGFWEFDEAMPANQVLLPFSRGEEILEKLGTVEWNDENIGTFSLDFMLKSGSAHIEKDIQEMITGHGYQYENRGEENYIGYGVNWGYVAAQANHLFDLQTLLMLAAVLALIIFTGYLMIYNVFRISVSNEIRYYGLLKTIGTTGRQIRRIISIQACVLSAVGIPLGLLAGYGAGAVLAPKVFEQLDGIHRDTLSTSPVIFVGSALFSFATVLLSCQKPGRIAAKISPVEAVRYTESSGKQKIRKSQKGADILKMAAANLSRSKSKTILTMLSLSLSAGLLNFTVAFTDSFDMDKYLRRMPVDFLVADAGYFESGVFFSGDTALPETVLSDLMAEGTIADSEKGVTYGAVTQVSEHVTWEWIEANERSYLSGEQLEILKNSQRGQDGLYEDSIELYGMEQFNLEHLQVFDGDITKLYGEGNYIAAVYRTDDYGNMLPESHWAKVGDKVKLTFADGNEFVIKNQKTGEVYESVEEIPESEKENIRMTPSKEHEAVYEVAALVEVPHALSYRYYSGDQFVLNAENFRRETHTAEILYFAFAGREGAKEEMESFLADYTENVEPMLNYESKLTYAEDFDSFRKMFLLLGMVLSFIVGLVGVLNFTNTVITGIIARRREFAVLQSIGMTGGQLKKMLMAEGMYDTIGSLAMTTVLSVVCAPMFKKACESLFSFCNYQNTLLPILILLPVFSLLGILIPLISCRIIERKSIVERLRETE